MSVDTTPDYAFLFATFKDSSGSPTSNLSYVPSSANGDATTALPPAPVGNPYVFWAWADGFQNQSVTVAGNSSATTLTLSASAAVMDAPVYLIGDAQAAAFGAAGISLTGYSPGTHRLWINASSADLAAPFLRLNDFDYPEFVLLATDRINTSLYVNGFEQASASFTFMVWTADHGLVPLTIPGWTQAYYFFYGNGTFSVTGVSVEGNSTVDSLYPPTFPPGAVEFFGTHGSLANDVGASQDCEGVVAMDARSITITNVTATTGAAGVTILDSSTIIGGTIHATGADPLDGLPSLAAYLYNTTTVTLSAITATNQAIGINASNGSGLTVNGLTASTSAYGFMGGNLTSLTITAVSISESSNGIFLDNASVASLSGVTVETLSTGLALNDTNRVQLTGLSVDGTSSAGAWTNSTQLTAGAVTVAGSGTFLLLNLDRSVTVAGVNATVLYALAMQISNSTFVNVSGIDVANGAIGVAFDSDSSVRLSGVEAYDGSVGAELGQVAGGTIVNLIALGGSIGILWTNGSDGAISWGNVSTGSLGAYVSNVTNLSITSFNGTEAALASAEFLNTANGSTYPTSVVATSNDTNVTVSNISSVEYPYAVWDNNSTLAQVDHVTAWNGGIGVALNNTTESKITTVFSLGGQIGVYLLNVSNTSLSTSTLEDGVADGLEVVNGTNLTVEGNNFVANNGSSTNGVFSAAHLQATLLVNNSSVFTFASNYWADHSSGAYVLTPHVRDSSPLTAALPYWLRFIEIGLPAHTGWGFTHFSIPYATTEPTLYIPGWSLAAGAFRYAVGTTPGYVPSPASGATSVLPCHQRHRDDHLLEGIQRQLLRDGTARWHDVGREAEPDHRHECDDGHRRLGRLRRAERNLLLHRGRGARLPPLRDALHGLPAGRWPTGDKDAGVGGLRLQRHVHGNRPSQRHEMVDPGRRYAEVKGGCLTRVPVGQRNVPVHRADRFRIRFERDGEQRRRQRSRGIRVDHVHGGRLHIERASDLRLHRCRGRRGRRAGSGGRAAAASFEPASPYGAPSPQRRPVQARLAGSPFAPRSLPRRAATGPVADRNRGAYSGLGLRRRRFSSGASSPSLGRSLRLYGRALPPYRGGPRRSPPEGGPRAPRYRLKPPPRPPPPRSSQRPRTGPDSRRGPRENRFPQATHSPVTVPSGAVENRRGPPHSRHGRADAEENGRLPSSPERTKFCRRPRSGASDGPPSE